MIEEECGGTFFAEKSSPTPLQKSTHKKYQKKIPKIPIDGRRAPCARFAIASAWAPPRPRALREFICKAKTIFVWDDVLASRTTVKQLSERVGLVGLTAVRSRSRSDSPPDCHSLRSRRFATLIACGSISEPCVRAVCLSANERLVLIAPL